MRKADLLKPESLKDITKDMDVVVHLAGLMRFHDPFDLLYENNVKATQLIAQDALAMAYNISFTLVRQRP